MKKATSDAKNSPQISNAFFENVWPEPRNVKVKKENDLEFWTREKETIAFMTPAVLRTVSSQSCDLITKDGCIDLQNLLTKLQAYCLEPQRHYRYVLGSVLSQSGEQGIGYTLHLGEGFGVQVEILMLESKEEQAFTQRVMREAQKAARYVETLVTAASQPANMVTIVEKMFKACLGDYVYVSSGAITMPTMPDGPQATLQLLHHHLLAKASLSTIKLTSGTSLGENAISNASIPSSIRTNFKQVSTSASTGSGMRKNESDEDFQLAFLPANPESEVDFPFIYDKTYDRKNGWLWQFSPRVRIAGYTVPRTEAGVHPRCYMLDEVIDKVIEDHRQHPTETTYYLIPMAVSRQTNQLWADWKNYVRFHAEAAVLRIQCHKSSIDATLCYAQPNAQPLLRKIAQPLVDLVASPPGMGRTQEVFDKKNILMPSIQCLYQPVLSDEKTLDALVESVLKSLPLVQPDPIAGPSTEPTETFYDSSQHLDPEPEDRLSDIDLDEVSLPSTRRPSVSEIQVDAAQTVANLQQKQKKK